MSKVTTRTRWSRALAAHPVPAPLRPMKCTLLALAPLMSPTGVLEVWREQMTAATGMPVRSLPGTCGKPSKPGG